MTEEIKPKRRTANRRPRLAAVETVNFEDYPEIHSFVKDRAKANCRSVGQEILSRLQTAMKQNKGSFQAKD